MDIINKVLATKAAADKLTTRKAYTVHVEGRDLAGRIVSRAKAAKIAKRLRRSGFVATPRLFGMVNLTIKEMHRFG